ncbi:MAG: hypothetical protein V1793_17915 [Pseudomonadota bacterium]
MPGYFTKRVEEKIRSVAVFRTPAGITLTCIVLYMGFALVFLGVNRFNPAGFIWFGERFVQENQLPIDVGKALSPIGSDGQFFFRLALAPLSDSVMDQGIRFDFPAYRQQRIVYPLLVRLISFGNATATAWAMVAVNIIAMGGIAYGAAVILRDRGAEPAGALALVLYPGWTISVARDLSEPVAMACVIASLCLLLRQRETSATLLLCLGVLARETTLLVAVAAALYRVWLMLKGRRQAFPFLPWHYALLPGLCFAAWQSILFFRWGVFPVFAGQSVNLAMPFKGILMSLIRFLTFSHLDCYVFLAEFLWLFMVACMTLRCLGQALPLLSISWILYGIMALTYAPVIWDNHLGFYRALVEFNTYGILIIMLSSLSNRLLTLPVWALFWCVAAMSEIYFRLV